MRPSLCHGQRRARPRTSRPPRAVSHCHCNTTFRLASAHDMVCYGLLCFVLRRDMFQTQRNERALHRSHTTTKLNHIRTPFVCRFPGCGKLYRHGSTLSRHQAKQKHRPQDRREDVPRSSARSSKKVLLKPAEAFRCPFIGCTRVVRPVKATLDAVSVFL